MSDVINAHDLGVAGGYIIEAAMQWDIDQLKAENAKLHAELTDLRLGSCPSCGIKVENERLREMCRDLVGELRGLGIDFTRVSWCEYADELRELGIEVDG